MRREEYGVVSPKVLPLVAAGPAFDEKGHRATVTFLGAGDTVSAPVHEKPRETAHAISGANGAPPEADL